MQADRRDVGGQEAQMTEGVYGSRIGIDDRRYGNYGTMPG